MTKPHPINPPPELIDQWQAEAGGDHRLLALRATQWGADAELNACVAVLRSTTARHLSDELRALRRDVEGLTPIQVLRLEPELQNPLLRGGVRTVEQIIDRGPARLMILNNLGPHRVGRIMAAVHRYEAGAQA